MAEVEETGNRPPAMVFREFHRGSASRCHAISAMREPHWLGLLNCDSPPPMARCSRMSIFILCCFRMEVRCPLAVASFDVDERTAQLLAELQKTFGVKTNAAVIRKALALANVASQHAAADKTITIANEGQMPVKVSLAG